MNKKETDSAFCYILIYYIKIYFKWLTTGKLNEKKIDFLHVPARKFIG